MIRLLLREIEKRMVFPHVNRRTACVSMPHGSLVGRADSSSAEEGYRPSEDHSD